MPARRSSPFRGDIESIPTKANKVLNIIFIAIILITLRLWVLSIIQHEDKVEESKKPRRRAIIEKPTRASIRDRFNQPLALNKVQFNATISYSLIKEIPSIVTVTHPDGKKERVFKRKEHIKNLAASVGHILNMDAERLEDLIHAKAAILNHIPLVIKENLSETEYFRLKILEKDLLGLQVERVPKRYYPKGPIGCDVIGHMGAISKDEFDKIIYEIHSLKSYLAASEEEKGGSTLPLGYTSSENVRKRLKELQETAYTINDSIGKAGIERSFDETLRGFRGKKIFYTDTRGHLLRELPGTQKPLPGKRLLLTISSELQEFAEALLAENEALRDGKSRRLDKKTKTFVPIKQPWIKGGSIIVIDPNNGEVLALASYPRIDPNDFIPTTDPVTKSEKMGNIHRWLETETYLAELWDQKQPLKRERYSFKSKKFYEESKYIDWKNYLEFILPKEHPIQETLATFNKITHANKIIEAVLELKELFQDSKMPLVFNKLFFESDHIPSKMQGSSEEKQEIDFCIESNAQRIQEIKKKLKPFFINIPSNYEKLLLVDLYFLFLNYEALSQELLCSIGKKTLEELRQIEAAFASVQSIVKKQALPLFQQHDFKEWKAHNLKSFLEKMREQEKLKHSYQKPYIDYIDKQEKILFDLFWEEHRLELIHLFVSGEEGLDNNLSPVYKNHFLNQFHSIDETPQSEAEASDWLKHYSLLKQELYTIPSPLVGEYLAALRSYNDLTAPLLGYYPSLRSSQGKQLQKHLAAAFYPKNGFGYGRSHAFRQAVQLGSIFKLVTSYTALIQPYMRNYFPEDHALSNKELNPLTVIDDLHRSGKTSSPWNVGYFLDNEPIPQMYKGGRIPKSQHAHIGKVDLAKAIESSSNLYFALLAGDIIEKPEDLVRAAKNFSYGARTGISLPGEFAGQVPSDIHLNKSNLYALSIGQHSLVTTPLQSAVMLSAIANKGFVLKPSIVMLQAGKSLFQPDENPFSQRDFPYKDCLSLVGIDFPLFTEPLLQYNKNSVLAHSTRVERKVFLPDSVRRYLLESMNQVILGSKGTARAQIIKTFSHRPDVITDYLSLQNQLTGKTSTAEMMERIDLSLDGVQMVNHIGFAGISFKPAKIPEDIFSHPELVVIVYLRFGDYGKEAAPIAAQVIKKWREIQSQLDEDPVPKL